MSSAEKNAFIGFPVPLLGERPVRLPVLWHSPEASALVIDKPGGVAVLPDNWYGRAPVLTYALNHQVEAGKPELRRMGLARELLAVHSLDPELSGPVLFTYDPEHLDLLRNALGSGFWRFTFRFVATGGGNAEHLQCSLPLARHRGEPRVVVSHTTGKAAATVFRRVATIGGRYAEWEAETAYPRLHQLFVHARETGLSVCGDSRYGSSAVPSVADLKRNYRPSRRFEEAPPVYPGPFARLAALRFGETEETVRTIEALPPGKWASGLRLLREHA
ncbi:MAG: hypothetical protein JJU00_11995 [Opitutales bacterium]|nr:hypothetical protein [Opitutales bacterium]